SRAGFASNTFCGVTGTYCPHSSATPSVSTGADGGQLRKGEKRTMIRPESHTVGLALAVVDIHGKWSEDCHDDRAVDEDEAHPSGVKGAAHEFPDAADDHGDGVDIHGRLKPVGHGLWVDEDVGGEYQWHDDEHGHAHGCTFGAYRQGDGGPDPGQAEAEYQQQKKRHGHAQEPSFWAET